MRVLVNAVSIREGGPLTVLSKLLPSMQRLRPDVEWIAALNSGSSEELGIAAKVLHADIDQTPFHLFHWYERALPKALSVNRADVLFSVTNYLPRSHLPCPALLLEQHAGHFSPEFERLHDARHSALIARALWRRKKKWVHRSVARADALTVQTKALADAIARTGARARDAIDVIPHGPGWVAQRGNMHASVRKEAPFRIGYVSKWGVQKNFETLFRAVRRLKDAGEMVRLVLTLDADAATSRETLNLASNDGISDLIENHGEVGAGAVQAIYDSLDAYAFPSVCESFGMTMVEAMARAVPIAAADTAVNREVTGDASLLFGPYDDEALSKILMGLIHNEAEANDRSKRSLARATAFSWEKAAEETLGVLERLCAKSKMRG